MGNMLSKKVEGILSKTIIEAKKALDFTEEPGAIMTMSASWHRVAEGEKRKENIDMSEFTFLLVNEGKPTQVDVSFEKGKFSKTVVNLSKDLGAVRNIGNFGAHPIKSKRTGEIIEVEIGEAEWNLNILEQLFDFYFVQPEISRKKRENLNKKLKDAGKPQMK